jgi:myo-inositol-hexaphosphate 3-phosphohydrolase
MDRTRSNRVNARLIGLLVAAVFAALVRVTAAAVVVWPLDRELDGPGTNVDDPCFWVHPTDRAASLLFVTAKDSGLVEVYNAASGAFVASIEGFGRPNNCAVDGDLLLTTDRTAHEVKVHHLPDLAFMRSFGQDMVKPEGIDVLTTPSGAGEVYVTDSNDASVHIYALDTGALVRTFATGFGAGIEPILADDRHQRIYVARGEKELVRGIGWFTPEGTLVQEFGASEFSSDAEGMALYACGDGGYLVAADQRSSATDFEVFDRVTLAHLGTARLQDDTGEPTDSTDGLDSLQTPLPGFPYGILAACDGCGSSLPDEMDVVGWERIALALGLDVCPGGTPPERLAATADTYVRSGEPDANFGSDPGLDIEADPPGRIAESLLRFEVPEEADRTIAHATLRLTVPVEANADSDTGGELFAAAGGWTEAGVTYATRPAAIGNPIGSAGPVAQGQTVDFDVSRVVRRGGTYDFLLRSTSLNRARYKSREAGADPPTLVFVRVPVSRSQVLTLEAEADGYVVNRFPTRSFGTRRVLRARRGTTSEMQAFLRFVIAGTAGHVIERGVLQLTVTGGGAASAAALYPAEATGWGEATLTYATRPAITGPAVASHGGVRKRERLALDVTSALGGDGQVAFSLLAASAKAVSYAAREAPSAQPTLVLSLRPPEEP